MIQFSNNKNREYDLEEEISEIKYIFAKKKLMRQNTGLEYWQNITLN
jgi:hypothetical protein